MLLTSKANGLFPGAWLTIAASRQVHSLSVAASFFFGGLVWNRKTGPLVEFAVAAAVKGWIWTLLMADNRM
jgi:hypothetical protein